MELKERDTEKECEQNVFDVDVTRQITSQNIHVQHAISNDSNRLSEREARIIGKAVADVVNDRMEEFKFIFKDRELGRAIREALK